MTVFVFGSNLAGIHGAGAALVAFRTYGARWHVGVGRQGNSYAIPTKDERIRSLLLTQIKISVEGFCMHAVTHNEETFFVTRIGCGLAGFEDKDIGPLFKDAPSNCILPIEWKPYLNEATASRVTFHDWEAQQLANR